MDSELRMESKIDALLEGPSTDARGTGVTDSDTFEHDGATQRWHRVAAHDQIDDGRVVTVCKSATCRSRFAPVGDRYGALHNRCPHQGGPLGEGSIEKGMLRCPWHGYDYCPLTGCRRSVRRVRDVPWRCARTASTSASPATRRHARTVSDVMAETLVNWGVRHVFGMVGHSNLGLADALRRQERPATDLHRHPPRGRGRVRRLGLRQADRPPGRVPDDRRARRHEPADRAVGREGRPLAGDRADRPGRHAGARPRRLPGGRPRRRLRPVAAWSQTVLERAEHAELMTLACKHAILRRDVAHLDLPRRGAGARGPPDAARRARRAASPPPQSPPRRSRSRGGGCWRRPSVR